jgi:hypothetical protein
MMLRRFEIALSVLALSAALRTVELVRRLRR